MTPDKSVLADSPPATQNETIIYHESESFSLIEYGQPHQEDFPPTEDYPTRRENTADSIALILEVAKRHSNQVEGLRKKPARDSLATRRLLDAASVMVTAASVETSRDTTEKNEESGLEDAQVPVQFECPPPPVDTPVDETSTITPAINNGTSDEDGSETQIPTQYLARLSNNAPVPTTLPLNITTKRPRGRPKKAVPVYPSTPSLALPEFWADCQAIYPDASEIAEALQDPGKKAMKVVNGVRQPFTTFPLIQKLSSKIYQQIQAVYHNPEGLTKNTSRGRESLAGNILMARKLSDATNLDPFFHKYAINGQVYIVTNNPINSGLNIPIKEFQRTIVTMLRKAKASRTSNDGLRLALTLLDPKYRSSVAIIMTNKKDRSQSDINGNHVTNLFEQILEDSFKNPLYSPPQPSQNLFGDISAEEYSTWDPNDPKIFEVDRTAAWLLETWKLYVKRKYKIALDRWNKETGGGNGQAWSFVNYCDKDARWLVTVFLKDVEANYLLAANAGGRMPNHLQMESGFEKSSPETSSLSSGDQKSRATRKKKAITDELNETKKLKSDLSDMVVLLTSVYKKEKQTPSENGKKSDIIFQDLRDVNIALSDIDYLNSMSPRTREAYVDGMKYRRRRLALQLKELETETNTESD